MITAFAPASPISRGQAAKYRLCSLDVHSDDDGHVSRCDLQTGTIGVTRPSALDGSSERVARSPDTDANRLGASWLQRHGILERRYGCATDIIASQSSLPFAAVHPISKIPTTMDPAH